MKFTLKCEDDREELIEMAFEHNTLPGVLDAMARFLCACGFTYLESLEAVHHNVCTCGNSDDDYNCVDNT